MYRDKYAENEQLFKLHPYKIFMYLLLGSLTALFLGISVSYLYQIVNHQIDTITPPAVFMLNSILLLGSSWFIIRANKAYQRDDTKGYTRSLIITLILTILFMIAQTAGWTYMISNRMLASDNPSTGYLYVISGTMYWHFLDALWIYLVVFFLLMKVVKVLMY